MMDVDMWDRLEGILANVQPGLLGHILHKGILKEEIFMTLVREEDGEEYKAVQFTGDVHSFIYHCDIFYRVGLGNTIAF